MAGLFSSGEQDLLGNIMTQRQQANQALGSGYGKYGGIVQAAGGLIDTGTDAMFGGKVGAADPRMQQLQGAKAIFAKVSKEMVDVKSPAFFERLSQELQAAGFPEQAQKAADEAVRQKKQGYEMGAMERDANYRKELASLGANPTTAQLAALDQKYGNVEGVRAAATAAEAKTEKTKVTEAETKRIKTIAEALVKRDPKLPLAFAEVIAGDPKALMDFVNPKVKTTFKTVGKRVGMYNSETGDLIKDIGAAGDSDVKALAGSVAALAQSMGEDQAQKAAQAGGQGVGEQIAQVNAGVKSLGYLTDALDIVDDGIYAGGYGPMQEAAAKYSKGVLGSKERLANTEEFRAYIGNVVIPMMSQLGGSDSNEELKKMEKIVAGDTTLEESAIRNILKSAQKAVRNDLEFLEKQQKAILEGKPLPTRRSKATEGVTASGTKYKVKD